MIKTIQRWWNNFRSSKLGIPVVFLFAYFVFSAILVLLFEAARNEEFHNLLDAVWWAIITVSTTGYGDKVPVTVGGRIVAILSIFLGMGAMSFLAGTMASFFVDRNVKAREGLMDLRRLKNHIVICGWKDHMMEILLDILRLNEDLSADDIVIISNIDSEKISELKEQRELKGLRFVKGDYFSEPSLRRANVKDAKKVLVMADTLESTAASEVDSKTVITVLTLRDMARDVYICVELLDQKYEHYLKQAMCDEIILIRDYGRLLLANSSTKNGISHIIHSLLHMEGGGARIDTCEIPQEYIGRPYSDFKAYIDSTGDRITLGLLENTGSPNKMKMEALREAQKTSDVSRLVTNLTEVKNLEVNKPVLQPEDDYIVPGHAMGIVLERTREREEVKSR
jgi:voltage-gated potassium channel